MFTNETSIDFLRAYLHMASEVFGRKNLLEAIKKWRKDKPRIQIPKYPIIKHIKLKRRSKSHGYKNQTFIQE